MDLPLDGYELPDTNRILTPALLVHIDYVDSNVEATLRMLGGDAGRWRPHIKTAKIPAVLQRMMTYGIRAFKCSTTLELLTACESGADDVLVAFAMTGANAERTLEIASEFPRTRISVLVEAAEQAQFWSRTGLGVFVDVNPGMDRTGINQERADQVLELARTINADFRGLHYYDGHMSGVPPAEREAQAHRGYDRLLAIVQALAAANISVNEVITSGTPAAPYGYSYPGFAKASFLHRISPGTVVYNDTTSLEQLRGFGYRAAVTVLTTVISHPMAARVTCDAGHKSVSADAGVPTCVVMGRPDLQPLKPSEEHLPLEVTPGAPAPNIGERLYLVPRHVCPTVNNFDEALIVEGGMIRGSARVRARGHENPLTLIRDYAAIS
ncbi:MAG: alanine racemase [Acidobacteriaceae bacterium]|nr:alanine racemase [Acidobacteriota bacterium]MBV8810113.1 alanine racemase [Acidobacteriaceae bacterium]MBV9502891.1 alanine racemase [Acidobacteriaceae bacterium]